MFCRNCGTKLSDEAKFCFSCGSPVVIRPTEQAPEAIPDYVEPVADLEPAPEPIPAPAPVPTPAVDLQPASIAPAAEAEASNAVEVTLPKDDQTGGKAKKRMPSGVVILLAAVFGILTFVFGLYGAVGISAYNTLSQHKISNNVAELNLVDCTIGDVLTEESVIEYMESINLDTSGIDEDMTLGDFIVYISNIDKLTTSDVEKIIEDSTIMKYAGDVIGAYEDYIVSGEDSNPISVSKLMKVIEKSGKVIEDNSGYPVNDMLDGIRKTLEEHSSELKKAAPAKLTGDIGDITSKALSPVTIIISAALALICIALVFITTRSVPAMLISGGVSCLLNGVLLTVSSLSLDSIIAAAGFKYRSLRKVVVGIASPFTDELLTFGIYVGIFGLLLTVAFVVVKIVSSKLRNKAM